MKGGLEWRPFLEVYCMVVLNGGPFELLNEFIIWTFQTIKKTGSSSKYNPISSFYCHYFNFFLNINFNTFLTFIHLVIIIL